jgi:hypothetical protein
MKTRSKNSTVLPHQYVEDVFDLSDQESSIEKK